MACCWHFFIYLSALFSDWWVLQPLVLPCFPGFSTFSHKRKKKKEKGGEVWERCKPPISTNIEYTIYGIYNMSGADVVLTIITNIQYHLWNIGADYNNRRHGLSCLNLRGHAYWPADHIKHQPASSSGRNYNTTDWHAKTLSARCLLQERVHVVQVFYS